MSIFNGYKTSVAKGQIHISYSILGMGLLILALLVGGIAVSNSIFGWGIVLREFISMCAFGCVTIGLVYNAASLQYNYELNKQKFEKEEKQSNDRKIELTYSAVSEWYKNDMAMNREVARRFMQPFKGRLGNPKILKKFRKQLNRDIVIRKSFISVLNYFEHLALLATDNVIDEEIFKRTFKTAITSYYTNLKDYIEDEQAGNSGGNAKIFINFVGIAKKWLNT